MRYDIMKAAFHDELEKISGTPKGLREVLKKGLASKAKNLTHAQDYALHRDAANHMGRQAAKVMSRKNVAENSKDFVDDWERGYFERRSGRQAKRMAESLRGSGNPPKGKVTIKKEAGAFQGHVRSGRRPLKADTLLRKETEGSKDTKKKIADLTKLSTKADVVSKLIPDAKTLGLLGIGAYGMHRLQKMNRRYQTGRQMEMQQPQGW